MPNSTTIFLLLASLLSIRAVSSASIPHPQHYSFHWEAPNVKRSQPSKYHPRIHYEVSLHHNVYNIDLDDRIGSVHNCHIKANSEAEIPTEITICLTPETSQDDVPIDRGNIIVGSSHWGCWDDGYLDGRTVPFYMRILKVDWSYSSSCARLLVQHISPLHIFRTASVDIMVPQIAGNGSASQHSRLDSRWHVTADHITILPTISEDFSGVTLFTYNRLPKKVPDIFKAFQIKLDPLTFELGAYFYFRLEVSVLTVEVLETGLIVDAALSAALDIDINPGIKVDKAKQLMAPKTMGTVVIPLAEIPVEVTITLEIDAYFKADIEEDFFSYQIGFNFAPKELELGISYHHKQGFQLQSTPHPLEKAFSLISKPKGPSGGPSFDMSLTVAPLVGMYLYGIIGVSGGLGPKVDLAGDLNQHCNMGLYLDVTAELDGVVQIEPIRLPWPIGQVTLSGMLPYAFKHKLPFIPVLDIFEGCIGGQPRTASWWTGGWSSCSAECGGGQQTRDVICKIDGEDAPNNLVYLCDLGKKPPSRQQCNTLSCQDFCSSRKSCSDCTASASVSAGCIWCAAQATCSSIREKNQGWNYDDECSPIGMWANPTNCLAPVPALTMDSSVPTTISPRTDVTIKWTGGGSFPVTFLVFLGTVESPSNSINLSSGGFFYIEEHIPNTGSYTWSVLEFPVADSISLYIVTEWDHLHNARSFAVPHQLSNSTNFYQIGTWEECSKPCYDGSAVNLPVQYRTINCAEYNEGLITPGPQGRDSGSGHCANLIYPPDYGLPLSQPCNDVLCMVFPIELGATSIASGVEAGHTYFLTFNGGSRGGDSRFFLRYRTSDDSAWQYRDNFLGLPQYLPSGNSWNWTIPQDAQYMPYLQLRLGIVGHDEFEDVSPTFSVKGAVSFLATLRSYQEGYQYNKTINFTAITANSVYGPVSVQTFFYGKDPAISLDIPSVDGYHYDGDVIAIELSADFTATFNGSMDLTVIYTDDQGQLQEHGNQFFSIWTGESTIFYCPFLNSQCEGCSQYAYCRYSLVSLGCEAFSGELEDYPDPARPFHQAPHAGDNYLQCDALPWPACHANDIYEHFEYEDHTVHYLTTEGRPSCGVPVCGLNGDQYDAKGPCRWINLESFPPYQNYSVCVVSTTPGFSPRINIIANDVYDNSCGAGACLTSSLDFFPPLYECSIDGVGKGVYAEWARPDRGDDGDTTTALLITGQNRQEKGTFAIQWQAVTGPSPAAAAPQDQASSPRRNSPALTMNRRASDVETASPLSQINANLPSSNPVVESECEFNSNLSAPHWYLLEPSIRNDLVEVSTCHSNTTVDTVLRVYRAQSTPSGKGANGLYGAFSCIKFSDDCTSSNCRVGASRLVVSLPFENHNTYFVAVQAKNRVTLPPSSYHLLRQSSSLVDDSSASPSQCQSAIYLPEGDAHGITHSLKYTSNNSFNPQPDCYSTASIGGDWYFFDGEDGKTFDLSTCDASAVSDTHIFVYQTSMMETVPPISHTDSNSVMCNGALECVAQRWADDSTNAHSSCPWNGFASNVRIYSETSRRYFVRVSSANGVGRYRLSRHLVHTHINDCGSSRPLAIGESVIMSTSPSSEELSGTTEINILDSYRSALQCDTTYSGDSNRGVWFSFTATDNQTHIIRVVSTWRSTSFVPFVNIYERDSEDKDSYVCNSLYCTVPIDGVNGRDREVTVQTTIGNTYLIRVEGRDRSMGEFCVSVDGSCQL